MPIQAGTRLGQYEILEQIGAGGMGEAYRALDMGLGREVAVKTLPEHFTNEQDLLARFQREAKLLAALQNPHIAIIHGIAEIEGKNLLILELAQGETLEERLRKGRIPLDETLSAALQISKALEAAHEKGIIHRDLKPANVKIDKDGMIKLLDFGLAKANENPPNIQNVSDSPTIPISNMTAKGMILGTAAYMSPEQARGKTVDRRTDIWSFGVILFEMVTGKAPFYGETVSDILASVLTQEPNWNSFPADAPQFLKNLIRRCMNRNPSRRLRDIGEARVLIEDYLAGRLQTIEPVSEPPARKSPRINFALAVATVFALAAAIMLWKLFYSNRPAQLVMLSATLPEKVELTSDQWPILTISPDGKSLAFIGTTDENTEIYLRRLDRAESTAVPGTEGAIDVFFSPDSQWLGFFARGKLMKIPIHGGTPVVLTEARDSRGASWGVNDRIIFTPSFATGLMAINATGGKIQTVTKLDAAKGERTHRWPQILPDGDTVLFTSGSWKSPADYDDSEIVALSLKSGKRKVVAQARMARYLESGHLLYLKESTLYGARFSPKNFEFSAPAVALRNGVDGEASSGAGNFALSSNGTLAYIPTNISPKSNLVFVDRKGAMTQLPLTPGSYRFPRFSPNGTRIAFCIGSGKAGEFDVWTYDLKKQTLNRLTFDSSSYSPIWTPDGNKVVYTSTSGMGVYWKAADGTGEAELLFDQPMLAGSWASSGNVLACTAAMQDIDIYLVAINGDRKPKPYMNSDHGECCPSFSPDGRFLAYNSSETGRTEVFVKSYSDKVGGKWQISTEGGFMPIWSRDGKEIFFTKVTKMFVVDVVTEPVFKASAPRLLIKGPYDFRTVADLNYDISPDGQKILAVQKSGLSELKQINVILNWEAEVKRIMSSQQQKSK